MSFIRKKLESLWNNEQDEPQEMSVISKTPQEKQETETPAECLNADFQVDRAALADSILTEVKKYNGDAKGKARQNQVIEFCRENLDNAALALHKPNDFLVKVLNPVLFSWNDEEDPSDHNMGFVLGTSQTLRAHITTGIFNYLLNDIAKLKSQCSETHKLFLDALMKFNFEDRRLFRLFNQEVTKTQRGVLRALMIFQTFIFKSEAELFDGLIALEQLAINSNSYKPDLPAVDMTVVKANLLEESKSLRKNLLKVLCAKAGLSETKVKALKAEIKPFVVAGPGGGAVCTATFKNDKKQKVLDEIKKRRPEFNSPAVTSSYR